MGQLTTVQPFSFSFIPEPATKYFSGYFDLWYETSIETLSLPAVFETMCWRDRDPAQIWLLDYLYDIGIYKYTEGIGFSLEFPVDKRDWPDYHFHKSDEYWENWQETYELAYIIDIKNYMDYHHISYADLFMQPDHLRVDHKGAFRNLPFREVW